MECGNIQLDKPLYMFYPYLASYTQVTLTQQSSLKTT